MSEKKPIKASAIPADWKPGDTPIVLDEDPDDVTGVQVEPPKRAT